MADPLYKVFVSHGWHDRWVGAQIARGIVEAGATPVIDVFDFKKGDDFEDRIFEEMPACRELVVLLTPWSVDRNWVWVEIGAARALALRIVPVLYGVTLDGIEREKGGKTFIGAKNVLELNDMDVYFSELAERVMELRNVG